MEKQERIPTRDDYYASYFKHEYEVGLCISFAPAAMSVLPRRPSNSPWIRVHRWERMQRAFDKSIGYLAFFSYCRLLSA